MTEKCRWTSISRDVFGTCQGEHNRNGLALALAALYEETLNSKGFGTIELNLPWDATLFEERWLCSLGPTRTSSMLEKRLCDMDKFGLGEFCSVVPRL